MTWTAPDDVVARTLRRRRWASAGRWSFGVVAVLSMMAAHARAGHGVTDWSRFQRHPVRITRALDGQTLGFTTSSGASDTLRLLGVAAPVRSDFGAAAATEYLRGVAEGRTATLLLDSPQTRDDQGRLLAFVFLSDDDLLNTDIVRDGVAYTERRRSGLLQEPIDTAERAARKAHRGMWRNLQWNQTPLWRRQWFATRPRD